MIVSLNEDRIVEVEGKLDELKVSDIIEILEEEDLQYKVIRELAEKIDYKILLPIVTGFSLVTYQLATKAEEHWKLFRKFILESDNPLKGFSNFLLQSPSLAKYRGVRLRRVKKLFRNLFNRLYSDAKHYLTDLERYWRDITLAVQSNPQSKTVIFAVKMAYYLAKALGFNPSLPRKILVPVDYRVSLVSLTSKIIDVSPNPSSWHEYRRIASFIKSTKSKMVQKAWHIIGQDLGINALKLDTLLWIYGGIIDEAKLNYDVAVNLLDKIGWRERRNEAIEVLKILLSLA